MSLIGIIIVIVIVIFIGLTIFNSETDPFDTMGGWIGTIWEYLVKLFDVVVFVVLGIVVLPAMFVMAQWYPVWEKWIKEIDKMKEDFIRIIFLIPLSVVIGLAMIIMQLLHPFFEKRVEDWFGKKPF